MKDLVAVQRKMEEDQLISSRTKILNQFTKLASQKGGDTTPEGMALKRLGIKRLSGSLEEYLNAPIRGRSSVRRKPLLAFKGKEDELALLVISSVLRCLLERPTSLQGVTGSIRRELVNTALLTQFKVEQPKLNSYLEYEYKRRGADYILSRKKRLAQMLLTNEAEAIGQDTAVALLDVLIQSNIGLIEILRRHKDNRIGKNKTQMYFLSLSADAREVIDKIQEFLTQMSILYKPILLPPKKWSIESYDTIIHGGYFFSNTIPLVKHKSKISRELFNKHLDYCNDNPESEESIKFNDLCEVINGIQNTKWRVNSYILDLVRLIIDGNLTDPNAPSDNPKCIGDIPYMEYIDVDKLILKETYGETYVTTNNKGEQYTRHTNKADYKSYYTAREKTLAKLEAINSNRVMFKLAISLAEEFKEYNCFYYSYTTDFRGRLYPVQQILNPQSHSRVKALLEFGDGVIPDEVGLYWIKVGIANSSGRDKLEFKDRVQWVDDNLLLIKEVVESPLDHVAWWNDTDEPLLFLSGCKALVDGLNGLPVHYPVPLDATCSGIQIYSGLLLDKEGAEAVNVLQTGTTPSDIYGKVADRVNLYLAKGEYPPFFEFTDSEGVLRKAYTYTEAKGLEGNVTRYWTKRNVMTQPYSVTKRGMYDQLKELFDKEESEGNHFWRGEKWVNIRLLVVLNSRAIEEIVTGATKGQEFLKDTAFYLNVENKPIKWLTPFFKFPVIQAQTRIAEKRIISALGKIKFRSFTNDIDRRRQTNAIAPNYIHSLDATLLYMTVQRCRKDGVKSFSVIHDSFAVDCNSVHLLNKHVRESYYDLFKSEPLLDWYNQVQQQAVCDIPVHPSDVIVGDLDLSEVLNSTYMFS